jgi:hypothetical protein
VTIIHADHVRYFGQGDEDLFFEGQYRNRAFKSVQGVGRRLFIAVDSRRFTRSAAIDLAALYYRWGVDMRQLQPIFTGKFKAALSAYNDHWCDLIEGHAIDDRDLPRFDL